MFVIPRNVFVFRNSFVVFVISKKEKKRFFFSDSKGFRFVHRSRFPGLDGEKGGERDFGSVDPSHTRLRNEDRAPRYSLWPSNSFPSKPVVPNFEGGSAPGILGADIETPSEIGHLLINTPFFNSL